MNGRDLKIDTFLSANENTHESSVKKLPSLLNFHISSDFPEPLLPEKKNDLLFTEIALACIASSAL